MSKSYGSIRHSLEHVIKNGNSNNFTHKCYFHQSNIITHFCINKKCTLPLCQKCLIIHKKQHTKQKQSIGTQNIIPFHQAYTYAIENLRSMINLENTQRNSLWQKISNLKNKINQEVDFYFTQIKNTIFKDQDKQKLMEEKYNKISKGSLKALIFYYSQVEKEGNTKSNLLNYKIDQNVSFNKLSQQIGKIMKQLINLLNVKQQNSIISNAKYVTINPIKTHQQFQIQKKGEEKQFQRQNIQKSFSQPPKVYSIYKNQVKQLPKKYQQLKQKDMNSQTDLIQLLRDQKQRLNKIKTKNYNLAFQYTSLNDYKNEKIGSKSMDNFYQQNIKRQQIHTKDKNKEINRYQTSDNQQQTNYRKQQIQSRPLQIKLNKSSINQKRQIQQPRNQKKYIQLSSSLSQLQKIKRKYIGDQCHSKSKQKIKYFSTYKNQQDNSFRECNNKFQQYKKRVDRYNHKLDEYQKSQSFSNQKNKIKANSLSAEKITSQKENNKIQKQSKQEKISKQCKQEKESLNKVLTRQQIRLNIQNKIQSNYLNKKSVNSNANGILSRNSLKNQTSQRKQTSNLLNKQPQNKSIKKLDKQFTLNKNYNVDTCRLNSQRQKPLMSSIKRQLRIQEGQGIDKKDYKYMNFFDQCFQNQQSTNKTRQLQTLSPNKHNQNIQTKNNPKYIKHQYGCKRISGDNRKQTDQIKNIPYEGIKEKIRLSVPSVGKNDLKQTNENSGKQNKQPFQKSPENLGSKYSSNRQNMGHSKRFNYLAQ